MIKQYDHLTVAPEPSLGSAELYKDASATGNIAIQVPAAGGGLLRVAPGFVTDEIFVKTS